MKITRKILKHRAKQALDQAKHLDISGLGIGAIEGLEYCQQLQVLDLSHNNLEEVDGITCCKHLWNVNLSHNKISSLYDISQFYAFGTLDLSYNNLSWQELARIQNVIIIDLHLIGNPELEKDSYYRIHVIDCLPNIWMLDGRMITSAERNQAQNFFHDSALSSRPVRKKLSEKASATRQRLNASSIHGIRTSLLVSRFARNEIHSAETDQRRLLFLFENMQTDLSVIPKSYTNISYFPTDYFHQIIAARGEEREHCNVLLLVLLTSLEFSLPKVLLDETLKITQLGSYANLDISLIFDLERQWRIRLCSLLLSASKLDRDMCVEESGGLYDRLYLCLYYLVSDLIRSDWKNWRRRSSATIDKAKDHRKCMSSYLRPHTGHNLKEANFAKKIMDESKDEHRMLLASEILLLLSVVPSFYKYIENDPALRALLQASTNDVTLTSKIVENVKETREQGGDMENLCREISNNSVQQIERATLGIRFAAISHYLFLADQEKFFPTNETRSEWKIILNTRKAYSKRPKSAILTSGEHLTSGKQRANSNMQRGFDSKGSVLQSSNHPKLTLGSNILLGPQNMAKVIAIPEPNIALVQMNSVPAPNGSIIIQTRNEDDHYCYVDSKRLEYDNLLNCWKPVGSIGDKVTLHAAVKAQKVDPSYPKMLDALMREKDYQKSSQGYRSRLSSIVSSKTSVTARNLTAKQETDVHVPINAEHDTTELDSETNDASLPPRPLSALFKEKMNLCLPTPSHDAWTAWNKIDDLPFSDSFDLLLTPQSASLDKSRLVAGDMVDAEPEFSFQSNTVTDFQTNSVDLPNIEISEPIETSDVTKDGPLPELVQDKEQEPEQITSHDPKAIDEQDHELVDDEREPELQALVDQQPTAGENVKNPGVASNICLPSEHGRRALSARRPKHTKVNENSRPVSAVVRSRNVRGSAQKLYGDELELERPDSASSFQLERTEAWRSSASSSMNLNFDENPSKSNFGFLSANVIPKKGSVHVVALHPTPPQRPSSPLHATSKKGTSVGRSQPITPISMDHNRDRRIKLASNWLADGKDLHEEYKKSRVYMSPHIPGYLSGMNNKSSSSKITSLSLPLTASLSVIQDGPTSVRSSRRATPTLLHRDYIPPGIGVPISEHKARFSPIGDVRKLSAKYPAVTLARPHYKK